MAQEDQEYQYIEEWEKVVLGCGCEVIVDGRNLMEVIKYCFKHNDETSTIPWQNRI